MSEVGYRVIAVEGTNARRTKLFGHGVYVGDLNIPAGTMTCLGKLEWGPPVRNPCIVLDSGAVVWGTQCWWSTIEEWEHKVDPTRPVVFVDPPDNPMMSDEDLFCALAFLPGARDVWRAKIREMAVKVTEGVGV